jgi:hypothetical protein
MGGGTDLPCFLKGLTIKIALPENQGKRDQSQKRTETADRLSNTPWKPHDDKFYTDVPIKKEGKSNGRGNGEYLGKADDFSGTWNRPEEKFCPNDINKVGQKHQEYTDDSNPLKLTT